MIKIQWKICCTEIYCSRSEKKNTLSNEKEHAYDRLRIIYAILFKKKTVALFFFLFCCSFPNLAIFLNENIVIKINACAPLAVFSPYSKLRMNLALVRFGFVFNIYFFLCRRPPVVWIRFASFAFLPFIFAFECHFLRSLLILGGEKHHDNIDETQMKKQNKDRQREERNMKERPCHLVRDKLECSSKDEKK